MLNETNVTRGLAALDADVAAAEQRVAAAEDALSEARVLLAEALASRRGVEKFLSLVMPDVRRDDSDRGAAVMTRPNPSRGTNTGLTHVIEDVVRESRGAVISVDDVFNVPRVGQMASGREQVRNGLHYLSRKGILESAGRRGHWRLVDDAEGAAGHAPDPSSASAPAATGAEEDGESTSDSPLEEGGTDDGSAPPDGRDDRALETHELHGHGVRRAAIGGSVNL